jgi:hypothetical protein
MSKCKLFLFLFGNDTTSISYYLLMNLIFDLVFNFNFFITLIKTKGEQNCNVDLNLSCLSIVMLIYISDLNLSAACVLLPALWNLREHIDIGFFFFSLFLDFGFGVF